MTRRWKAWCRKGAGFNPSAPAAGKSPIVLWGPAMCWFDARARAACLFGCGTDEVGLRELTGSTLEPRKLSSRLGELLEEADAVVTLDYERNITHPCFFCRTTESPRDLITVGSRVHQTDTGSFVWVDAVKRPVCGDCVMPLLVVPADEPSSTTAHDYVIERDVQVDGFLAPMKGRK